MSTILASDVLRTAEDAFEFQVPSTRREPVAQDDFEGEDEDFVDDFDEEDFDDDFDDDFEEEDDDGYENPFEGDQDEVGGENQLDFDAPLLDE